jgi:hypothetical protein
MARIARRFSGHDDDEIFDKVHEIMERIAQEFSLDYRQDGKLRRGEVSKMGIKGSFSVRASEVVVDMKYPILVPGSMRAKIEDHIERKLDSLFA